MVMKFMDNAISELDSMDSLISTYKIHLNVSVTVASSMRLTFP